MAILKRFKCEFQEVAEPTAEKVVAFGYFWYIRLWGTLATRRSWTILFT